MIYWIQNTHGNGNQEDIVQESPHKIDLDATEGGLTNPEGIYNIIEGVFHQNYVSSVNCNIRARVDGHSNISLGQYGTVIDPITNEHYLLLTVILIVFDHPLLVLRVCTVHNFTGVNPHMPSYLIGRMLVVPCYHSYPDLEHLPQVLYYFP